MVGFDDAALVGLIMALVEAAKRTGMPARFAPLLALALGVVAGVFLVSPGDVVQGVVWGIAMGLVFVGLYSGGKNVVRRDNCWQSKSSYTRAKGGLIRVPWPR